MLNVITSTKTVDRGDGEFTVTTWTVGGYTLVRTECPALGHDSWEVYTPHGLPSIVDMSDFMAKSPKFGVNWSSCGTQSSTDARAYGAQIMAAADVADVFNRITASS